MGFFQDTQCGRRRRSPDSIKGLWHNRFWIGIPFYALVVAWTLVETAVGYAHAVTDRVSLARIETGRAGLSARQAGWLAAAILLLAAALSRFGIIALVARGYGAMAWGFLALFVAPLLTVGVRRIWRAGSAGRA